jgi:hypothetical protein
LSVLRPQVFVTWFRADVGVSVSRAVIDHGERYGNCNSRQDVQDGQDDEDDCFGGTAPCPSGLKKQAERLSRMVASRAAVPFGSLGRWREEPGAERRIFLILLILPILSMQFPQLQFPQSSNGYHADQQLIVRRDRE